MYFDQKLAPQNSVQQLLMTLIRQFIRQSPDSIHHVKSLWALKSQQSTNELTVNDRKSLLQKIMGDYGQVFVVVDALDETDDSSAVLGVLDSIRQSEQAPTWSLLITSRDSLRIETLTKPLMPLRVAVTDRNKLDLKEYIETSMTDLIQKGSLKFRKDSLMQIAKDTIFNRSQGLFLQAKFHLEHLSRMKNDKAITKALNNLPNALDDSYERILDRIKREHLETMPEVKRMLIWLSHSIEPVPADLLVEAAAINAEDTYSDQDAIATDSEELITILGSLVVVDHRVEPALVALSHLSLFDYLHSDSIKRSAVADFSIDTLASHRYLAKTCGQYLGFSDFANPLTLSQNTEEDGAGRAILPFKALYRRTVSGLFSRDIHKIDDKIQVRLEEYALLRYAAQHWPEHLKHGYFKSGVDTADSDLLNNYSWFLDPSKQCKGNFNSWHETHHCFCSVPDDCEYRHSPLTFSIILGLDVFFDILFTGHEDLNSTLPGGWTPLTAAAFGRSTHIVQRLLSAGADVEQKANRCHNGFGALHLAAENADLKMVTVLLENHASVHSFD